MTDLPKTSGSTEAIILIKASPRVGQRHGETVCCAGLDLHGNWLRLYPVSFKDLKHKQRFGRWDRITFDWRLPKDDQRSESRRVNQQTLEIVGELKPRERGPFLGKAVVTSLIREREAGRSLALLRPEILEFIAERKSAESLGDETARFSAMRAQADMFTKETTPYSPCPWRFKYRYRTDDGEREGTCQDWEIEATFRNWKQHFGSEERAIDEMKRIFGEEYPKRGMVLAMGTHSLYPDQWLINGVVRLDEVRQASLF